MNQILKKSLRRISFSVVLLCVLLAACTSGDSGGSSGEGAINVVTTFSPITNLAANVGGDRIELQGIVPEGTNSHTFEPAPSDAAVMEDADVVFINGLHLEEPTRELAEANVGDGVEIVELGDMTITPSEYIFDFSFPRSGGDPNPHLWTNPPYAKRYAEIIKDKLSQLDPQNADYFAKNYGKLASRFDDLDAAAHKGTESVPPENRKLLTYHDSFPYFAREYGWEIVGAVQPADFAEPTAKEVAGLVDQVRAERIPAIFGSEVFSSPVLQQIAEETGAEYIDDLRDDDLPGEAGDPDHSLIGLLVFDYRTFMGALGGDPTAFDGVETSNVVESDTAEYRY
ncbi:MAG: metal ABC transporter substrate-binding protein [Actinomycetota bacterium]